jgi:hypothetical protein
MEYLETFTNTYAQKIVSLVTASLDTASPISRTAFSPYCTSYSRLQKAFIHELIAARSQVAK